MTNESHYPYTSLTLDDTIEFEIDHDGIGIVFNVDIADIPKMIERLQMLMEKHKERYNDE